ncbi:MAG: chromosomal replication initiator protein DnaA [Gemmatimonadaceae bacterium]
MSLSPSDAWSRLLALAGREVSEQVFRMWLEPLAPLAFTGSVLSLGAPDQFAIEWLSSKHGDLLSSLAPIALGHPCRVEFLIDERVRDRVQMDLFARPATPGGSPLSKPIPTRPQLSARYTFDHFVVGKSNELAAAAAMAVAEAPGRVYNPLFIYGASGLGKTHLMQAVAHHVLASVPTCRAIYIGAEQFTNDYVTAIQTRSMSLFRTRFRETDLLLVDDVHFLKNKEATQEEFFHTFNALYEAGRQIIVTSDRPPAEIPGLEDRLVTRFQWGLVTDVELPDLEHRIAILRKKAEVDDLQRSIPDDVIRFLAENMRGSIRELEGAIVRLLAFASLKQREVTLPLALEAFVDRIRASSPGSTEPRSTITIEAIQQAVSTVWEVPLQTLRSKSRTKKVAIARQAAMHLCRELLKLQLTEIGLAFSGRDHSTVIHSLERARDLLKTDPFFMKHYERAWFALTGISYQSHFLP